MIIDGLSAYNLSQIGYRDFRRRITVVVRDPLTGKAVGGLYGRSDFGKVYIYGLLLPEDFRRRGVGRIEQILRPPCLVRSMLTRSDGRHTPEV